jgi:CRISPR-associated endonuclease/helicase Cas3
MPSPFPTFEEFYAAVNDGRDPLPWQSRLASQVVREGWPTEIGVPTGLGKTSCLDIAVWALAAQADRDPRERTLPTRIWYVVNRRLLVDAAYAHGSRLADLLQGDWHREASISGVPGMGSDHSAASSIEAVASALRRIRGVGGTEDTPLLITRLRGAADLGERPAHPAHPAIIFATVPMFGSTWLFRSYAASPNMRPVDAAHAGIDSLVLLDEAHLSRPLRGLVEPVTECDLGDPAVVVPGARSRPVFVSLTATGDKDDSFELDEQDLANEVVKQRLRAPKPTQLMSVEKNEDAIAPELAEKLLSVLADRSRPMASVVFTNRPATARAVLDQLVKARKQRKSVLSEAELVMITGRMRQREAEIARARVLDEHSGAPSGRDREALTRHLVVVATQTLEVGADLDFDVLVTETCGARALIQRFGRLNRLGHVDDAAAVVVHPSKVKQWPVYGGEPAVVWERLQEKEAELGELDLCPARISEVVGEPGDQPQRLPELLPAHLWEWAKTTVPPPGEAPVELFFEGFATEGPRVTLCWRATSFGAGERLVPSVHADETIEVPLGEVREALDQRFGAGAELTCLARDRVTVERVRVDQLRPADIIVLRPGDGLYDEHGWAPTSRAEVIDVSLPHWPGLPLDPVALSHWFVASPVLEEVVLLAKRISEGDEDLDLGEVGELLQTLTGELEPRQEIAEAWAAFRLELTAKVDASSLPPLLLRKREKHQRRESQLLAADAFDDLSASARSVRLDEHLQSVGELAGLIAAAVGLSAPLVEAVAAAGRFHDLGKSDERFQAWLWEGRSPEVLRAKSDTPPWRRESARLLAGWPKGGRHEALSARLVHAWLAQIGEPQWDPDLVLHLVLSHHGFGRPLLWPVEDDTATVCRATVGDRVVEVSASLADVDWDQPARFRRCCERYGYWGLALLEAIMRQADHLASSQAAGEPLEVA